MPVNEAQPLPEAGAYAFATLAALVGDYDLAFVVVLGFCALLRIGEVMQLTPADLHFGMYYDGSRFLLVQLRRTKSGLPGVERVVLTNQRVLSFIYFLLQRNPRHPDVRIVSLSYLAITKRLAIMSSFFQYSVTFRSHSLRRGGATALLNHGFPFNDIALYGRWSSERSAKLYLRKAETLLISMACGRAAYFNLLANTFDQIFHYL